MQEPRRFSLKGAAMDAATMCDSIRQLDRVYMFLRKRDERVNPVPEPSMALPNSCWRVELRRVESTRPDGNSIRLTGVYISGFNPTKQLNPLL